MHAPQWSPCHNCSLLPVHNLPDIRSPQQAVLVSSGVLAPRGSQCPEAGPLTRLPAPAAQTHSYEIRLEGQSGLRNTDAAHLAAYTADDDSAEADAAGGTLQEAGREDSKGDAAEGEPAAVVVGGSAALSAAALLVPDSVMAKKKEAEKQATGRDSDR